MGPDARRARLEALYATHGMAVHRYLRRRTDQATADDLLSDVFVAAWTRVEEVPLDSLPWLLSCARNFVAHSQRSERRRAALLERLRVLTPRDVPWTERPQGRLGEALRLLSERDREAILLIAWEGLSPDQAAQAMGCSQRAFAMRLHRARKRLAAALRATEATYHPTLTEACND